MLFSRSQQNGLAESEETMETTEIELTEEEERQLRILHVRRGIELPLVADERHLIPALQDHGLVHQSGFEVMITPAGDEWCEPATVCLQCSTETNKIEGALCTPCALMDAEDVVAHELAHMPGRV
jgi:hypothetical protein